MKKLMFAALVGCMAFAGCQTRITAEKYAEQVLPIQQKVTINGEDQLITTHYQIASGGWYATARSPLYATEGLEGLEIGVETNGSVRLSLGKYNRDLSTNATVMVDGLMKNGANLVTAIGDAYVKIAGGGAQAATVMDVAASCYKFFADKGGDASKATVAVDEAAKKLTISDGSVFVECNEAGVCKDCQVPAAN